MFASDARGDGFIQNSWFNTQTVNFLATVNVTPDDRFTFKLINNDLDARLPIAVVAQPVLPKPIPAWMRVGKYTGVRDHVIVQQWLQRQQDRHYCSQ